MFISLIIHINQKQGRSREEENSGSCPTVWKHRDATGGRFHLEEIRPERNTWIQVPTVWLVLYTYNC